MPDSDVREDFDLPLVLLGEAQVHAEHLGDEERGLVAAGAGAEFEDDVLLVVGIFGQQKDFELFFDGGECAARGVSISSCAMARRSGSVSASMALASAMPSLILRYSRNFSTVGSMSRCCLGDGLELLLVVDQCGVGHLLAEVFVAGFELVEAVKHIEKSL